MYCALSIDLLPIKGIIQSKVLDPTVRIFFSNPLQLLAVAAYQIQNFVMPD